MLRTMSSIFGNGMNLSPDCPIQPPKVMNCPDSSVLLVAWKHGHTPIHWNMNLLNDPHGLLPINFIL